jgi:hypothetical protein
VKCNEHNHVLQIEKAEYGRSRTIFCQENDANSTRMCGMKDVTEIINPLCENKQKCDSFVVNASNLGQLEKCRYVWKYLLMTVECGKFIWHRWDNQEGGEDRKKILQTPPPTVIHYNHNE